MGGDLTSAAICGGFVTRSKRIKIYTYAVMFANALILSCSVYWTATGEITPEISFKVDGITNAILLMCFLISFHYVYTKYYSIKKFRKLGYLTNYRIMAHKLVGLIASMLCCMLATVLYGLDGSVLYVIICLLMPYFVYLGTQYLFLLFQLLSSRFLGL